MEICTEGYLMTLFEESQPAEAVYFHPPWEQDPKSWAIQSQIINKKICKKEKWEASHMFIVPSIVAIATFSI
jgi:hypothetical protein